MGPQLETITPTEHNVLSYNEPAWARQLLCSCFHAAVAIVTVVLVMEDFLGGEVGRMVQVRKGASQTVHGGELVWQPRRWSLVGCHVSLFNVPQSFFLTHK
jgi:hypothetical protein